MKKFIKIISLIITCILIVSVFAGCESKKDDTDTAKNEITTIPVENTKTTDIEMNGFIYAIDKTAVKAPITNGYSFTSQDGTIVVYTSDKVEFFSWDDAHNDLESQFAVSLKDVLGFTLDRQYIDNETFVANEYDEHVQRVYGSFEGKDSSGITKKIAYVGFYQLTDSNAAKFCFGIIEEDPITGLTNSAYINDSIDCIINGLRATSVN